jgi:hypothetical protein
MTRARDIADQQDNLGGAVAPFVGAKNFIINGNFDSWQRGTSFTFASGGATTSRYTTDRWSYGGESGFTISRQTAVNTGSSYALRLQRNSGSTSTGDQFLAYVLESSMAQQFAGQTATLSFYLRKGADFSGSSTYALIRTGTGTDEGVSAMYMSAWAGYVQQIKTQAPTTTSTRYSFTFTIPSNVKELGFLIGYAGASGTAGANDWIEYEQMQFEIGSVATPFSRAGGTIQGEIALCQRYYIRQTGTQPNAVYASSLAFGTTGVVVNYQVPVSMRVYPTAVEYSALRITDNVGAYNVTNLTLNTDGGTSNTINLTATVASGLTQFRGYFLTGANTNNFVGLSAEL